jgi:hypothetical protein
MNFREWMDYGRAAFLFKRVLKGLFPTGKMIPLRQEKGLQFSAMVGNRIIMFTLTEGPEPYVDIEFQWDSVPDDVEGAHAKTLQRGSIQVIHTLQDVSAAFARVGLGVKYHALEMGRDEEQEKARYRLYGRIMKKSGFTPLSEPDSPIQYHRPAKIA